MPSMEDFETLLVNTLKARPGIIKQKLAVAMDMEYGEEFREKLDAACAKKIAHRVQDRYYPGTYKQY
jgi:hypothetical protein